MSRPRRPRHGGACPGVGDVLQLGEDEPGHDELIVEDVGFHQVGNAAVNNHAGIQNVRFKPFDLLGKLHVRNDEAKVIFRLQKEADAGVAEDHAQNQF